MLKASDIKLWTTNQFDVVLTIRQAIWKKDAEHIMKRHLLANSSSDKAKTRGLEAKASEFQGQGQGP